MLPKTGPRSQPSNVAAMVAIPIPKTGSTGMMRTIWSPSSGCEANVTKAEKVVRVEERMEEASEYRRRDLRSAKNVFQSRTIEDVIGFVVVVVVVGVVVVVEA